MKNSSSFLCRLKTYLISSISISLKGHKIEKRNVKRKRKEEETVYILKIHLYFYIVKTRQEGTK